MEFLNLHMYPLTNGRVDYLRRAVEWIELARAEGMGVIIGEAWLYKASAKEVGGRISYQELNRRQSLAILSGDLTGTGRAYQALISEP